MLVRNMPLDVSHISRFTHEVATRNQQVAIVAFLDGDVEVAVLADRCRPHRLIGPVAHLALLS
jgi:hypothetical protein